VGYRALPRMLSAVAEPQNYRAASNIFRYMASPLRTLIDYIALPSAGFPRKVRVRTPIGPVEPTLYSADDLITLVECFARLDYDISDDVRCVVDIGSNIGISALYFLSRNAEVKTYLFEPVPRNLERIEHNLLPFRGRYQVDDSAVGTSSGNANFGCEPTGRYGGLELPLPQRIPVLVRDANEVLRSVLAKEKAIDVLKLDVEGMEVPILSHLADDVLDGVRVIYAETFGKGPTLPGFTRDERGAIVKYQRVEN
jgi:FkbM family methyltransferase